LEELKPSSHEESHDQPHRNERAERKDAFRAAAPGQQPDGHPAG
jgi:hypothetical protein